MKASAIEFRFRMLIMVVIVALGFWAPWIEFWGLGSRKSLLEWLALEVSRMGLLSFRYATPAVILAGALIALIGAVFRIWGTAYLGFGTVHHAAMQGGGVMADGPYRYVRNPLYIGTWCMMAAMAFVMPPSGALFTMTLVAIFLLRLILGEEAFLTGKLGEPYREYLRGVPRLIPRLRGVPPSGGQEPHWMIALLSELNPIGIFITMAVLSWSYDNMLMLRGIVISLGVSLVMRAFLVGRKADQ